MHTKHISVFNGGSPNFSRIPTKVQKAVLTKIEIQTITLPKVKPHVLHI